MGEVLTPSKWRVFQIKIWKVDVSHRNPQGTAITLLYGEKKRLAHSSCQIVGNPRDPVLELARRLIKVALLHGKGNQSAL